ncbi:restriction endonuclease subunit S [Pectobacterium versatile]|uniref:Restriction endonuclease subunit S n=1 Tax=Pectobacterium versatile TaxID=2488639 RepID=A0ABU8JT63_9GAMM|nr:restriction endonuclease subunit S [Pectobacterium versatile]UCP81288.1 restriction endonuclease subunit S [Pectobacterium versatile]
MVPEGWKHGFVKDLANTVMGYAFKSTDFVPDGIPLLRMGNLYQNMLDLERNPVFLPKRYLSDFSRFIVRPGDLVMSMTGTMGKRDYGFTVQIPDNVPELLLNQRVMKFEPKKDACLEYLLNLFRSEMFLNYLYSFPGGTKQANLSAKQVQVLPVLIPPKAEQKKIAKILSTWDKAITTTEQLLTNSQQQKKALMQKLLTGNKRLQGYSGDWKQYQLSDITNVIVSPVDKKSVVGEVPVELCNYTDVYYHHEITKEINFMKATASNNEIEKYSLKIGDVIITKDSETPGDIAVSALVSEELNGVVCGYHLAIVRPNKSAVSGAFLNYLFSMPKTRYYFFTLATGATRFGLSIGAINKAQFSLPTVAEQQKIANLLSISDKEIKALKQKLHYLKQEKKALMQQLLTGKRRVKVEAA